jgi:hypothetical protein
MRNRAKCKLCLDIIESKDVHEYVSCSCKQISIDGGDEYLRCSARDWNNFIRITDDGSEIPVKFEDSNNQKDSKQTKENVENQRMSRSELMNHLADHIRHSESLPPHVRQSFCTYMDLEAITSILYAILKETD